MTRLVRAELTKLRTIRLFYGVTAAMAAFGVLTVVANVTSAGQQGNPPLSAHSLPGLVGARPPHHPDRGWVVAAKLVAYTSSGSPWPSSRWPSRQRSRWRG
jgi:hypothetical protein